MADMSNWANFEHWLTAGNDERDEALTDLLAGIAEVWLDTPENVLVMGLIASTRALLDHIKQYGEQIEEDDAKQANRYIMGIYVHSLRQTMSNFQALIGLTDVKRGLA